MVVHTHSCLVCLPVGQSAAQGSTASHIEGVFHNFVGDIVSVVAVDNDELVSEVGIGSDNACVNVEAHVADPQLGARIERGLVPRYWEFLLVSQVHDFGFRG